MKMNKKGFTIVELVIVIAVIAILAGVLIPTFSGIVGKAQDSAALQEARNMYTEYVGMFDYSKGTEPAKNIVVKVDDEYIVVKGSKMQDKVYADIDEAKTAAGAGAIILCDEHAWGTPTGDATKTNTCGTCAATHTCDIAGANNKCSICGK